jgi:hypothetical protein
MEHTFRKARRALRSPGSRAGKIAQLVTKVDGNEIEAGGVGLEKTPTWRLKSATASAGRMEDTKGHDAG